jgi:hypothetical protein
MICMFNDDNWNTESEDEGHFTREEKKRGGLNHLWINTHVLFEEFLANLERNEEEKGTKAVNKQLWQCYMYELHNEIDDCVNERGCV